MNKLHNIILLIVLMASVNIIYAINDMPIIAAFQGEHHRSAFGHSMVSLDFNHDGLDDLAICSPNYGYVYPGTTDPGHGKLYFYYGVNGFNSNTYPAFTYEGSFDGSNGRVVLGIYKVGDISGDGFDDLCVFVEDHISWNESYTKLLFFYWGTPNLNNPDYVFNFTISMPTLMGLYSLGDINGDGHDDIGVSYPSPTQNAMSVIWGGSFAEHMVSGGEACFEYSCSINGIGDINNDGYDDFTTAFTTPTTNPTHNLIRLYYGNASGNTDNPITMLYCQYAVERGSKPLGDMNADGYDDFMGYVNVIGMQSWLGGTNINYDVPGFSLYPQWYGGEFLRSLEHGDFNNDGYEDAVGAHFGYRGFAIWLGKQHVNGTEDMTKYNSAYENFGYSLVTGDFNADGYDDIAIAASHEYDPWPSGNFNGYVWVYAGNAQLSDTTVANDDPVLPGIGDQFTLRVSPNPVTRANQALSVIIKGTASIGTEAISIEIFNIKGQSVYQETHDYHSGDGKYIVNTPSLSTGIYLCKVKSGKQTAIS